MSGAATLDAPCVPASAIAVANFFLTRGREDAGFPPIDQMKLQKLVYYAQAWYLAYHNTPLFLEDVEAWPWGPVVRPIYYQTRSFGRGPITSSLTELQFDSGAPLKPKFVAPEVSDPTLMQFLNLIWDVHKPFTGIQLSNSTHAPGEPWTIVRDQYGSLESKPIIPPDLMAAVFKGKNQGQNAGA
jgi:uncharacterized phage-associated protein